MGRQTWQAQVKATIKKAPHHYVSRPMLGDLEKEAGRRKGTVKEFRTLMAKMIEQGEAKVADTVAPQTYAEQVVLTTTGRKTAQAHLRKTRAIREKMTRWITQRASGTNEKIPRLTPAMTTQLVSIHSRRGTTAPEARAVLNTLEAEGSVITEVYKEEKYKRKKHQDIRTPTKQKHKQKITQRGPVALDLGSGWEGAKEGMSQHMRVIGVDRTRQMKGQEAGMTTPDLIMNLGKKTGKETVIEEVMRRTGTYREDLCHIHGSMDCGPESTLQRMNATQNRGKGEHAGEERPEEQEDTVQEIVKGIKKALEQDPTISYTLEQPKESALKNHPALASLPGEVRVIKACCYGYKWQKQTRIWTNLGKWWKPECTQQKRWLLKCPHCKECRENKLHKMCIIRRGPHDRRPLAKLPGFNKKASRNRIPTQMAAEWAKAALERQAAMRKK